MRVDRSLSSRNKMDPTITKWNKVREYLIANNTKIIAHKTSSKTLNYHPQITMPVNPLINTPLKIVTRSKTSQTS